MKEPQRYAFHFPSECRDEDDSMPPAGRRSQPDTLTMPKIAGTSGDPSDAPLQPPNGRDPGLAARPSHVELIVPPADLEEDGGQRFLRKVAAVLAERPGVVVVNLLSGPAPSSQAIGQLLRARADAETAGVRLVVRPVAPAHRERLRQLGGGDLL